MRLDLKKTAKNIFRKFSEEIYLFLIVFLLLDFIFMALISYQYYLSPKGEKPTLFISIQINQPLLDKFYSDYLSREEVFNKVEEGSYPNILRGPEKLTEY